MSDNLASLDAPQELAGVEGSKENIGQGNFNHLNFPDVVCKNPQWPQSHYGQSSPDSC